MRNWVLGNFERLSQDFPEPTLYVNFSFSLANRFSVHFKTVQVGFSVFRERYLMQQKLILFSLKEEAFPRISDKVI
jgi:hypothetical protein